MSMATIVDGLFAFPINYWLVNKHLKYGCMALPGADGPAAGLDHQSPEQQPTHAAMKLPGAVHEMPMGGSHSSGKQTDTADPAMHYRADDIHQHNGARANTKMDPTHSKPVGDRSDANASTHPSHAHPGMAMAELSVAASLTWVAATFALLSGALALTAQWIPISFG